MHLTNYKMLYMDKGKSFLIPTESSQGAQIWDLIKPVLLLQMLQLFIMPGFFQSSLAFIFTASHGSEVHQLSLTLWGTFSGWIKFTGAFASFS